MSSVPAKSFNSDSAREEAKKYSRPVLLREIITKSGKATVNDVKMAALRLGLSRKSKKSTNRPVHQIRVVPPRTYGNVPLSQQNPPQRPTAPSTISSTFYLAPTLGMNLANNMENAKFLAEWYTDNIDDIKLRSTISTITFASTSYKGIFGVRVIVAYTDPRGFELDYIKGLLTTELGEDDNKMVLISGGMFVDSTPARRVNLRTRVLV